MANVARTLAQLLTSFADNIVGAITAQNGRDLCVSALGYVSTRSPGVNDDNANTAGTGQFFDSGGTWIDTTHNTVWICISGAVGAALWQQLCCPGGGTLGPVPPAVTGLTAAASSGQVVLSWNPSLVANNGWQIYQSSNPDMSSATLIATTSSLTYTVTGLSNGVAVFFAVVPVGQGLNGPWGVAVVAAPPGVPVVVGYNSGVKAGTGATTVLTINKPTGTGNGDLLIGCWYERASIDAIPSGWTQLQLGTMTVGYKVAGLTEPASYTVQDSSTGDSIAGFIFLVRAQTANPTEGSNTTATSTTATAASVTTTTKSLVLALFAAQNGTETMTVQGSLAPTTTLNVAGTGPVSMTVGTLAQAASGATGAQTCSLSASAANFGVQVVVH